MKDKEKYEHGDYGFVPLTVMVDRYFSHSFNNGRQHYKNMVIIARDMWKELYWKTLRVTKHERVRVDQATMTVKIPPDCMRIIAVRVRDNCDRGQHLIYDAKKILVPPASHAGCGCKKCGCHSESCGLLSGINYVTENVDLNGETYQRVIKTKVCANGDLIQEITEPFAKLVDEEMEIVYRTYPNYVASLSVKPCGCVEDTASNMIKAIDVCGCPVVCCHQGCTTAQDVVGQYKIDTECGLIYLFDSAAAYVYITFISNGEECAKEILIPEYCMEAMFAMMYLGSIRFRHGIPSYEKRAAKQDAAVEKQELYEFLNPIVPHEFLDLQFAFPKW